MGNTSHVYAHQSIALYPSSRWLGETLKLTNRLSVEYLEDEYNRIVDTDTRYVERDDKTGCAKLLQDSTN